MIQMIEESFDIRVQNVIRIFSFNHHIQHLDCLVASFVRTETHHFFIKYGLENSFQHTSEGFLYYFIFITVDTQRSGLPVIFGNLDSACRFRFICFVLSSVHEIPDIFIQPALVCFLCNPIDSHCFASIHLSMAVFQHFAVYQMSNRCKYHVWVFS